MCKGIEHPEGRKLVINEDCRCPKLSKGVAFLASIIEPADQEEARNPPTMVETPPNSSERQ